MELSKFKSHMMAGEIDGGQGASEYAIVLGLVAVAVIAVVGTVLNQIGTHIATSGQTVNDIFSKATETGTANQKTAQS